MGGPAMPMPRLPMTSGARARAISSTWTICSGMPASRPPYSAGHVIPDPARLGEPPLPRAETADALVVGEPPRVLGAQVGGDVGLEPGAQLHPEGLQIAICHGPRIQGRAIRVEARPVAPRRPPR